MEALTTTTQTNKVIDLRKKVTVNKQAPESIVCPSRIVAVDHSVFKKDVNEKTHTKFMKQEFKRIQKSNPKAVSAKKLQF